MQAETKAPVSLPPSDEGVRAKFNRLAKEWKEGRGPSSSVRRLTAHPAHREIVAMGQVVVPLLLAELVREPDHWFIALHELTGAGPVPKESRGRLHEMAAAWVSWGKDNGLIS